MASAEQCIAAIRKAVGRDLSPADLEAVAETLQQRADARRQAGEDMATAEIKAAEELANDAREAAIVERRNRKINLATRARFRRHTEAWVAAGHDPALALKAWNVGVNTRGPGNRLSVDARQRSWLKKFVGGMLHDLDKADRSLVDILGKGHLDREIMREMWEIGRDGGQPGRTGSAQALQIAEILHKVQESARLAQNDRGAWVRQMPGYIVRQSHNELRIRKMGYDAWRDFILPKLDAEQTFKGRPPDEVLRASYDDIVSGGHLAHIADDIDEALAGFTGAANLAKRASRARVLHFRSADDFADYHDRLGRGSLAEAVVHGLERAAQNIGLFEAWGTNPRAMFDRERQRLIDAAHGDPKAVQALRSKDHDYQFMELTGETRIPANATLAVVGSVVRSVQSMAKLGGAVISSVSDLSMVAAESRARGNTILAGYKTALDSLARGRGKGEVRDIGNLIGAGTDGILGSVAARFMGNDDLPGTMAKLTRTFFRLNLLSWWTDAHKRGVGLMVSNDLARHRRTAFADLRPDLQQLLQGYGIGEAEWRLVQMMETRGADGREYIDPTGVRGLSDETIRSWMLATGQVERRKAPALARRATGREFERMEKTLKRIPDAAVRRARDNIETGLRAYMVDRAETAVPTPTARERAVLTQGTQAGTPLGEAIRFMGQFKQFPITVLWKPISEVMHGRRDMVGLAHLIVASTMLGYVAMSAKEIAKGREVRDPFGDDAHSTWTAAMLQGGGLGIFGDFVFGEYNRFGRSLTATVAGPTLGTADDLLEIWARLRNGEDAGAKAFQTMQANTPFLNLFYTRLAVDYMVSWHIQELLNPGALRRMERRMQREQDRSYFLSPAAVVR